MWSDSPGRKHRLTARDDGSLTIGRVAIKVDRSTREATVAASNPVVAQMDADQYETGEGPCLAAASEGHRFHIDALAKEQRWTEFVKRARAGSITK